MSPVCLAPGARQQDLLQAIMVRKAPSPWQRGQQGHGLWLVPFHVAWALLLSPYPGLCSFP